MLTRNYLNWMIDFTQITQGRLGVRWLRRGESGSAFEWELRRGRPGQGTTSSPAAFPDSVHRCAGLTAMMSVPQERERNWQAGRRGAAAAQGTQVPLSRSGC